MGRERRRAEEVPCKEAKGHADVPPRAGPGREDGGPVQTGERPARSGSKGLEGAVVI